MFLGNTIEAREKSSALVMTKIADVTDTPFAEELGSQERQDCLQGRDLLRAGQTRVGNSLGQIEVQQQGDEQKEAGHLGEELPSFSERQLPHVGDIGHYGTVVSKLTRRRVQMTLSCCGQARALKEAEEVRFA